MIEYRASASEESQAGSALGPVVRLIDTAIASLQRLRNRIEAPVEEENAGKRRKNAARVAEAAPAAAAKPARSRPFLLLALALAAGGLLGMNFSYRLLAHAIDANEATAGILRDDIAQLEKNGARLQQEKQRLQKQVYEDDKEIRALQSALADYRSEIDQLRGGPRATADAPGRATAPPKTGTCAMGTANAAADLARCVEEFNRR